MLYSYKECMQKYQSDYQLKLAMKKKEIFKICKGVYSDKDFLNELELIAFKYSNAVFTMYSALYYYNLTDVVPDYYYLRTDKDSAKIANRKVKQSFENDDNLNLGKVTILYDGVNINIYNKERLLIEVVKNKNKLPFDYYKEVIQNYRKIISSLDSQLLQDYAMELPSANRVIETLELEVF